MNRIAGICLALLALSAPVAQAEEQKNLAAVIAWSGEGRLFRIAPTTLEFLGSLEGIMYIETSEGAIDEAFVECAIRQTLQDDDTMNKATGNCMILQGPDDTVFANFHCDGETGSCKGEFRLTEGTGQFKGIRGSSELIIRTPLAHVSEGLASGAEIGVNSAVAILPNLSYSIGGKR